MKSSKRQSRLDILFLNLHVHTLSHRHISFCNWCAMKPLPWKHAQCVSQMHHFAMSYRYEKWILPIILDKSSHDMSYEIRAELYFFSLFGCLSFTAENCIGRPCWPGEGLASFPREQLRCSGNRYCFHQREWIVVSEKSNCEMAGQSAL